MKEKRPLYFIGWDYHSPQLMSIKRLLSHPASPWEAKAIVHDEVWVPSVDGIPLMRSKDFLVACSNEPEINALLLVKDPIHHKRWLRRFKEYGITMLDEGEIFQSTSIYLEAQGQEMDLGVMNLPQTLSKERVADLSSYLTLLDDPISQETLRAYIHFLETGLLDGLRKITRIETDHPLSTTDGWMASLPWRSATGTALAWEVAAQRTSFLEQALLLSSAATAKWSYALSFKEEKEGQRLSTLMRSFGIDPILSKISSETVNIPYRTPSGSKNAYNLICARIDIPNPIPLLKTLENCDADVHLSVRLGRNAEQLIQILESFGHTHPTLRCDRPGPLGLFARLTL